MSKTKITVTKDIPLSKEVIQKLYYRLGNKDEVIEELKQKIEDLENKKMEYSELCCDTDILIKVQNRINELNDELSSLVNYNNVDIEENTEINLSELTKEQFEDFIKKKVRSVIKGDNEQLSSIEKKKPKLYTISKGTRYVKSELSDDYIKKLCRKASESMIRDGSSK